jgi:hypothetical protein
VSLPVQTLRLPPFLKIPNQPTAVVAILAPPLLSPPGLLGTSTVINYVGGDARKRGCESGTINYKIQGKEILINIQ